MYKRQLGGCLHLAFCQGRRRGLFCPGKELGGEGGKSICWLPPFLLLSVGRKQEPRKSEWEDGEEAGAPSTEGALGCYSSKSQTHKHTSAPQRSS